MKASTSIRLVLAAVFTTLACAGMLAHVIGSAGLFLVVWLLVMGPWGLTRPIPRNECWLTFVVVGVLLAVAITSAFSYVPAIHNAVTNGVGYPLGVSALWVILMWAIYRRWQREKVKADA